MVNKTDKPPNDAKTGIPLNNANDLANQNIIPQKDGVRLIYNQMMLTEWSTRVVYQQN